MERSDLEKIRLEKAERLRAAGMEPYPTRSHVTHSAREALAAFEAAEAADSTEPVTVAVAGRLRAMRPMGKLTFAHIEDSTGRIQLFLRVNDLGEENFKLFNEEFDLGDIVEATGSLFRTRTGEITVNVSSFAMLAKSITPLPAAKDEVVDGEVVRHATLVDPETRFRQRYADLAVNPEVREIFRKRAAVVTALRKFLDGQGFLEVETPILQPIYGGAAAKPFVTHHNQLHQDLYLRISFELYLKRLIVGGLDRVYEIGRDFRNEGVSFKHNPEFTQLEFYMAYSDYLKVMDLTEQMISTIAMEVNGSYKIDFDGQEIDLTPPWKRIELRQGLIEVVGIDIKTHGDAASLEKAMTAKGLKFKPGSPRGKLIESMLGDFLEPTLIQPTFIYDYPRDISPLAKSKPGDPTTVERFEGYIGGMELCNAFTELNDPLDQQARFEEMGRAYGDEDEDRHPMDEDYLQAMLYGMPPQGGFGMGVDRLTMLLTGKRSIREVLLFPHLRERDVEK
jgi:lysyl-tRNA synthetase class 2